MIPRNTLWWSATLMILCACRIPIQIEHKRHQQLVYCIFGPNSPTHIFRPASIEFVNKSSYANIYSLWCSYFAWYLMVKMVQNRLSIGSWSLLAPWHQQQLGTSVVGGRSQGVASRTSPSFGDAKKWFLLPLPLKFRKKNNDLLQVQQPPLLQQLLLLLPIAEALFVTSTKDEDMLLLSVLVEGPWL